MRDCQPGPSALIWSTTSQLNRKDTRGNALDDLIDGSLDLVAIFRLRLLLAAGATQPGWQASCGAKSGRKEPESKVKGRQRKRPFRDLKPSWTTAVFAWISRGLGGRLAAHLSLADSGPEMLGTRIDLALPGPAVHGANFGG
jgi:hypothetical protein